MKRITCLIFVLFSLNQLHSQTTWKIAGDKIIAPWAEKMDVNNVLSNYPRPQMVRGNWKNLNGLWNYAITPIQGNIPNNFDGKILVPFAIEAALSGVGRTVGKDSLLWYQTAITLPTAFNNKKVLLHFGAVDWKTEIFLNGKKVGDHKGGYTPFSFDITQFLKKGEQELIVKVWDPTDEGSQPRGKQVRDPKGIWYTSVTGIWQTVWVEAVPHTFIARTINTPDVDAKALRIKVDIIHPQVGDKIRVMAFDKNQKIAEEESDATSGLSLKIEGAKLWSPERPFLYDLRIQVIRGRKIVDEVASYFAMRKSSLKKGTDGIQRMELNNKFLFQFGPLDQGWWPGGLYTAPSEDAMRFDIEKTKEMGFNLIRKHVKVEPAQWYYLCDSIGLMVWQDMPDGDLGNRWDSRPGVFGLASDKNRTAASESDFMNEWNEIMEALYNFPSIVCWVPFNEGWGQFKTKEITEWTMQKDPTRLVNSASGGNFYEVGHIIDLHNYPDPAMPDPELFGGKRALVLGEFGGLGLPIDGHTWQKKDNWGYQSYKSAEDMYKKYASFIGKLASFIEKGLSAAVYTQTTDVEVEVNGLMTYDRKVIKMPPEKLKTLNDKLYQISVE